MNRKRSFQCTVILGIPASIADKVKMSFLNGYSMLTEYVKALHSTTLELNKFNQLCFLNTCTNNLHSESKPLYKNNQLCDVSRKLQCSFLNSKLWRNRPTG